MRDFSRRSVSDAPAEPRVPGRRPALPHVIGDWRVVVLVLAGFFDGISDNWLHGLVLWAAACVVGWEAAKERDGSALPGQPLLSRPTTRWRARTSRAVLAVTAMVFAATVGSWQRFTWPMTTAIVLVAVAGLTVGWRAPLTTRAAAVTPDRIGTRLWVGLAVAAGLWELLALSQQPSLTRGSYAHPTISVLMDSVLSTHAGRSLTLLAWLALGWFLLLASGATSRARSPLLTTGGIDEMA
jgi:hypothetical protein